MFSSFFSPAALAGLLVFAALSGPSSLSTAFWDRYLSQRALLQAHPDSALAVAERTCATDPNDLLGRWLRGACLAARDSLRAAAVMRDAEANPGDRGLQIEAGTLWFARGRGDLGRAAYALARDRYAAAGDSVSAVRAVLWQALRSRERGEHAAGDRAIAEAESLARLTRDPETLADALMLHGERELSRDTELALRLFREAREWLAPLPLGYQRVAVHLQLGYGLTSLGELDSSASEYTRALELARARPDRMQEARAIAGLGKVAKSRGNYPEAVDLLTQVVELANATGNPRQIATAYHDLANLRWEMGYYFEAKECIQTSLRVLDEAGLNIDNKASALDALGGIEANLGEYDAAREHFEQALTMCRARDLKGFGCFVLLHYSSLKSQLGDPEGALALTDESLVMARGAGQRRIETVQLDLKAYLLNQAGLYEEALRTAREGQELARRVEPRILWRLVGDEAAALHGLGRTGEGIAAIDSMIARFPEMPDSLKLAEALMVQGRLLLARHEVARASSALERALALANAIGNPATLANARLALAPARLAAGRSAEAATLLEQGLGWFESVQSQVRASQERVGYQAMWHDAYTTLARAYVRTGKTRRAFATLERSRARELRRLFGRDPAALRHQVPRALSREVERVESALTAQQAMLLDQVAAEPGRRTKRVMELERRLDSLKTRWDELNLRVQREAPVYARESGLQHPRTAAEVLQALKPGERLLAYMVGGEASLVFDLRAGTIEAHEIRLREDTLTTRVAAFTEALRSGVADRTSAPGRTLAAALLAPVALAADPPATLYVLPDGALHHVPFEALPLAGAKGGMHYLAERSAVVYANSGTLWLAPNPRRAGRDTTVRVVAFGDPAAGSAPAGAAAPPTRGTVAALAGTAPPAVRGPLPYAREEALGLAARFPNARVFVGEQATESAFFAEAERASLLHVAAHAFVDDHHPEFSGIVLAPSTAPGAVPEDGLVQAFEVLERRFDLDLATLSACETGLGRLQRGEGLLGLARALRLAGTRQMVVSLWKVDDRATAAFMAEFYSRLSRGGSAAAALHGAKQAMIRGGTGVAGEGESGVRGVGVRSREASFASPSAWAAFVLLGSRAS